MTWGEIQIESLKKMFLNNDDLSIKEIENYKTNKKYKTYLFAMPQAFNEAIRYISNLEPIIKSYELAVEKERYDLSKIIDDYKCLENVISNKKWEMETNDILKIDKNVGSIIIYYEANPILVDSTTNVETTFDINKDCLQYVPLYIAAELYKDDDLTLSTVYMNEFMNNINMITGRTKNVINNKIVPIYTMD
ncbi:MAG: hypothetical protein HFI86_02205 [Bacilli bacterium]|nr:hypothetical protein [Bacilli bacterium]